MYNKVIYKYFLAGLYKSERPNYNRDCDENISSWS